MGRVALTGVGLIAVGIAALAVGARYLAITNHLVLFAAVLSPYLMLAAPLGLVALAALRRWMLTALAAAVTLAMIAVQAPLYIGSDPPTPSAAVRVMTANLRLGFLAPQQLIATAGEHADVLALQEVTPQAVRRLTAAGLDKIFPYRALDARDLASGVGLWSRYPIPDAQRVPGFEMAFVSARISVPGVPVDPTVLVLHMSGPWPQPLDTWQKDFARLPTVMADTAERAATGAVIVAGDFNTTVDERPFRDLLRDGWRDAAELAGAGMTPTYPADSWMPPLIAIDHVLIRNCGASSVHTASLPGSDHRALIATVQIPSR